MLGGVEQRFWIKVRPTATCWLWAASKDQKGYGYFRINGVLRRAHRVAYEAQFGPIPEGLTLDHLCRVTSCVNPLHLEPVTGGENTRRGMSPTHVARRSGKCFQGHPLSYRRTSGVGYCPTCARARVAIRKAAA